jgi:sigma-B regulation protein RsbU (phosphoserine phosphatase)
MTTSSSSARLSKARHDLRNPLSEILGFCEILEEEAGERHLDQLTAGLRAIHQAATRIFAEVNHSLTWDTLQADRNCLRELATTVQTLSDQIIALAEGLSVKCDELENSSFADDLMRITGSARSLKERAPSLFAELGTWLAELGPAGPSATTSPSPAIAGHDTDALPVEEPAARDSGNLLVVDDNEANRALLVRRLRRQGYTVALAENGRLALEKLRAHEFDLVLLDVIMPEMGGYQVLEKMKSDAQLRHIPVIMISALDDLEMLTRCIQCGAEDYLAKPFDPVLLRARVGSCLERKRLHDQEQRTYQALLESQQHLATELAEAARYVRSLLPMPLEGAVCADWRFLPSRALGGDAFGYSWLDSAHFAVYLLDVCSHGIGAALFSISVMNALRARTLPGIDFRKPGEVLRALNRTFPMEKQNHMYFTMWYGVYHGPSRELTYACGGHPPAVLVTGPTPDRAELARLKAPGPGVGALPDAAFPSRCVNIGRFNRLFLFSDGAFEIVKSDGSLLTLEEFVAQLGQSARRGSGSLDATLDFLRLLHGTEPYEDDLSLVEITFGS